MAAQSGSSLEVLHSALMLLRGLARIKGAKVPSLIRARIDLARIQPIFARPKLPYHGLASQLRFNCSACMKPRLTRAPKLTASIQMCRRPTDFRSQRYGRSLGPSEPTVATVPNGSRATNWRRWAKTGNRDGQPACCEAAIRPHSVLDHSCRSPLANFRKAATGVNYAGECLCHHSSVHYSDVRWRFTGIGKGSSHRTGY